MKNTSDESLNWNLNDIFTNKEELEKAKKELVEYIEKLKRFQGKLNNIVDIKNYYETKEKAYEIHAKLSCFVSLKFHQDMSNQKASKEYKEIEALSSIFGSSISFATPEISENSNEKLEEFAKDTELKKYERSIRKIIKSKEHILSKDVENALANYSEVFASVENAYDIFTTTEFEFSDVKDSEENILKMSHGLYSKYLAGRDRILRKNSFEAMYAPYRKNINTITELYLARVKDMVISAKLRNYKNSIDMATYYDDSNQLVYECLVEQVNKNLKLNQEHLKLKKEILQEELEDRTNAFI